MVKEKGRQWDGKSRPSDDLYRKRFNEIFKKVPDPFDIEVEEEEVSDEQMKEIEDRNGL